MSVFLSEANSPINMPAIYLADSCAFLLLVVLLAACFTRFRKRTKENSVLLIAIGVAFLLCVFDPLAFVFDGDPRYTNFYHFTNSLLFLAETGEALLWCLFLKYHFQLDIKTKILLAYLSPFLLLGIGLLVNSFYPFVFRIDENGVYSRMWGYYLYLGVDLLYILISVVFSVRDSYKSGGLIFFPIYLYLVPVALGVIFQYLFYGLSITIPCLAIALAGVLMSLQNEVIYTDGLTGLLNRSYLDYFQSKHLKRKHIHMTGLMLDMDNFKEINDELGHAMGDKALKRTAKILVATVGNEGRVMRYAGDEFIILLNTLDEEKVKSYIQAIKDNLSQEVFGSTSGLSISVGYSVYDSDKMTADEFLNEMDKKMYENKKKYHSSHPEKERRKNSED